MGHVTPDERPEGEPTTVSSRIAVHHTAIVAPDVEIGPGTIIGPYAVIVGPCQIGAKCWIGPHVVIGLTGEHTDEMIVQELPEEGDLPSEEELWFGRHGEGVAIGDRTIIRELSTIQSGTVGPTVIGSDVFMMNKCHAGHDVRTGDRVRLAPYATLGGHARIQDDANIGMAASIHQRRVIGRAAMVGMHATVVKDVRPFELVKGNPARGGALNRVWLEREGYDPADIDGLASHYAGTSADAPEPFRSALAAFDAALH